MIPAFTDRGTLPPGIHSATMEEIRTRFARFRRSDRRIRLFNRLEAYVEAVLIASLEDDILNYF